MLIDREPVSPSQASFQISLKAPSKRGSFFNLIFPYNGIEHSPEIVVHADSCAIFFRPVNCNTAVK